ncbi:MAG: SDR family NAD(P)-dependent oxidoreductase, partial [Alphaproteobacteria bacterium]|nr:SDR family NAD(P)-dependent oxidoreductase [Alphaproteobacteria bacterium]
MTQRILITGANRGIGLEMTRQALARGDNVIAACRAPDKAAALDELAAAHSDALTIIGLEARTEASVQAAAAMTTPLDLVVANAGTMNARGGLTDAGHTEENISDSLMTNIAGVFFTARHFLANLQAGAESRAAGIIPRIAVMSSQMGSTERAGTNAPIYRA